MKRFGRQILIGLLAAVLAFGALPGCNKSPAPASSAEGENSSAETGSNENSESELSGAEKYPEALNIDFFDGSANYQGEQTGWFGKIIKDKFNMTLNIIAPNVAGGGDTLYETRSAAGNLGDLVQVSAANGRLQEIVDAGLFLDLTDKVSGCKNLSAFPKAIEMSKGLVSDGKFYAMPIEVSNLPPTTPSEGLELTYGPYIRWDYYMDMGHPEIKDMDALMDLMKDMQEKYPKSDSGKPTYAFSFFSDWDGSMVQAAKNMLAPLYGFEENGFQLISADGHTTQSIIDKDSWYVKGLEYIFKANQMGLVDPESTTQNYDTMYAKYQDGAILYSPWPWLGQNAYNTDEHRNAGKGFMVAPVEGYKISSAGCAPGNRSVLAIGSKTKDADRMLDFLDWLYSPEGVEMSNAEVCGPEGLTWEMKDDRPVLTELGKKAHSGEEVTLPAEYGSASGVWKDISSQLNFHSVASLDIDPNSGEAYNYNTWDSYLDDRTTALDKSWKTTMNAKSTLDYWQQHDEYVVAPGTTYVAPDPGTEITTERNQCQTIICQYSWRMMFAKDQAEFDSLLKEMQTTVKGLGYDDCIEFDEKVAKETAAARDAATKG